MWTPRRGAASSGCPVAETVSSRRRRPSTVHAGIKSAAASVRKTVEELAPHEASVEMGFKLTAETGVILRKVGGEAHVKLTLTCGRRDPDARAPMRSLPQEWTTVLDARGVPIGVGVLV